MSRWTLVAVVLLLLALAAGWLAFGAAARPLPAHPFWSGSAPRVIAHRGGRGLWPENTLFAFRRAAALGVDVLEMDLRRTADGEIVVLHDGSVERTTDGQGAISSLTLAELRKLDAGYRWSADQGRTFPFRGQGITVPTLGEVFAALPEMRMNVEIKDPGPGMAAPLCALIRAHRMEQRVAVVSVDQEAIDAFRAACPEVATAAARNEVLHFTVLSKLFLGRRFAPRAEVLQVPERQGSVDLLTPRFVRDARRLNLKIEVWTVDEPEDMKRLLALPVDGIMTDYPDRLLPLAGR
jgi:glycerophosphoryl diester phosphodiesterase